MKKLVNIMGGSVIETESERLMCMGAAKMVVELGQENGLDDEVILKQMQEKTGLSSSRWPTERKESNNSGVNPSLPIL